MSKLIIEKIKLPSSNIYWLKDSDTRAMITTTNYATNTAYTVGSLIVYDNALYRVIKDISATDNTGWSVMTDVTDPHVVGTTVSDELQSIRSAISGVMHYIGVTTTKLTDGCQTNPITIDGQQVTLTTADAGAVVISGTGSDQKEFVWSGTTWNEFGSTGSLKALAFKDNATGTYEKANGGTVTVPTISPTISHLKATATDGAATITSTAAAITGFDAHSTTNFVTSYTGATSKLATTTVKSAGTAVSVPNVTNAGSASTWAFSIDSTDTEMLVISGGNSTAPTLGTALSCAGAGSDITVATGSLDSNGAGDTVMTGLGTASKSAGITALGTATTANCATAISLSTQPTITLTTPSSSDATTTDVITAVSTGTTSSSVSLTHTATSITVS